MVRRIGVGENSSRVPGWIGMHLDREPHEAAGGAAGDEEVRRMAEGTVKWFSEEEGYGFIAPDEGGDDIFVHYTAIEGVGFRSLDEGEKVSYEPGESRRGEIATNVRRLG
jgi:cold shock protein